MTPQQQKDLYIQYHEWKSKFSFWQKIKTAFIWSHRGYGDSFEYFMTNVYRPR